MLRNDYIMRQIEQFINSLARILNFKKSGEYVEAFQVAGETFQQLFGVGSKFFNSLSIRDLIALLKTNNILDKDRAIIIAALLKAEGDVFAVGGLPDESYYRHLKSLNLYLEAFLSDERTLLAEYFSDITSLLDSLESYELPAETKSRLWQYYEKDLCYSKAEDLLYELMEENTNQGPILEVVENFYHRLLQKSDQDLLAGGLPRDEIEEGLTGLHKLKESSRQES